MMDGQSEKPLVEDPSTEDGPYAPRDKMMDISLLLIEDDDLIRDSLLDWLDTVLLDSRVVGVSFEEVHRLFCTETPQVIVADIALSGGDGIEAIRSLHSAFPDAQIVALAVGGDLQAQRAIAAAGADACLPIWEVHEELEPTMRRLLGL